jgi:hypothetical protein
MRAVDLWIHSIKIPSCVFVTAFKISYRLEVNNTVFVVYKKLSVVLNCV